METLKEFFCELRQPSNFVEIVFNMYTYFAGGGVADNEHKLGELMDDIACAIIQEVTSQ